MPYPHFQAEQECHSKGYDVVAGVDEVGRGCLAGPVVAAAVILDPEKIPPGINDSKKLSAKKRGELDIQIRKSARAFAIGVGPVDEIDSINILNSSKQAMVRAVLQLSMAPKIILVDGNFRIPIQCPQRSIVGGDSVSLSIAAASIIAKVFRDSLMVEMDLKYPGYFFASNKGYGSQSHRLVLQTQGPSPIHRKSFSWTPV